MEKIDSCCVGKKGVWSHFTKAAIAILRCTWCKHTEFNPIRLYSPLTPAARNKI